MGTNTNSTTEQERDDAILPEGWDGSSDIFAEAAKSDTDTPPTTETSAVNEEAEVETPPTTEQEAEPEQEAPPTTEAEPETVTPPRTTIKVKYNHEEKEIDLDEAAPLVQKGLNYDRVAPTLDKANKLARQMGYASADEMIEAANDNYIQSQVQQLVDDGVHETVAKRTVQSMVAEAEAVEAKQRAEQEAQVEATNLARLQAERDKEIDVFIRTYPGVKTIPEEVKALNQTGVPLVAAYAQYETRLAQNELKILKQNQASAAKAPVGGATRHGSTDTKAKDAFETGFDDDTWA